MAVAVLAAAVLSACTTAVPPQVRVGDVNALVGSYSGKVRESRDFDHTARLVISPGGSFELFAGDPDGYRVTGAMVIAPDGTLVYRYDDSWKRSKIFTGRGTVHEGDGQRVIVLTHDDGSHATTVSKSLP
jgi:hypothetical protein